MRYFEIASSLRMPVSSDEQEILDKTHDGIDIETLNDRQQELARRMLSRGLLIRFSKDKKSFYKPNSAADIWRDLNDC